MIAVPNFMSFRFEKVRFRLGSNQIAGDMDDS